MASLRVVLRGPDISPMPLGCAARGAPACADYIDISFTFFIPPTPHIDISLSAIFLYFDLLPRQCRQVKYDAREMPAAAFPSGMLGKAYTIDGPCYISPRRPDAS